MNSSQANAFVSAALAVTLTVTCCLIALLPVIEGHDAVTPPAWIIGFASTAIGYYFGAHGQSQIEGAVTSSKDS